MFNDCKNNKSQPYYCIMCNDPDEDKHDHKSFRIAKEVEKIGEKWEALFKKVTVAAQKATELYEPMRPLIEHLESQMQVA